MRGEEDSVVRTERLLAATLALLGTLGLASACSSSGTGTSTSIAETNPSCLDGRLDGDETGVDCGGSCVTPCAGASGVSGASGSGGASSGGASSGGASSGGASSGGSSSGGGGIDGVKDGSETDVDCGGPSAPKCAEGKSCLVDADCEVACSYAHKCIMIPSCKPHLGGDTCGQGEVEEFGAAHESCCRSLPVAGYSDPAHPGKTVYLDKYEITVGRIRAFLQAVSDAYGGKPDVKSWVAAHRPQIWNPAWEVFLPSDTEGGSITIGRRLLGDPRPEDTGEPPGPGVTLPPTTDQVVQLGTNWQFGAQPYVYLHGNNCATWDGAYGFPTFYYPPAILARLGELPRVDGTGYTGATIPAKDLLDVKSMNCITNAMLTAFCAWDGGQLATDEVLDYVTATPPSLGNDSGCGTQYDDHGELLGNIFTHTVQTGGRCAPVALLNATFDAGDNLPVPNSPLNVHNYHYPDLGTSTSDKAWEVGAPGRASLALGANGQVDMVRIQAADEPWMDLNGNLSEAALDTAGGTFTGLFALKYRGIGYGSARSDLNMTLMKGETLLRIQRPEAKAAFTGGRCMRFK
jgi:hypothetical protein